MRLRMCSLFLDEIFYKYQLIQCGLKCHSRLVFSISFLSGFWMICQLMKMRELLRVPIVIVLLLISPFMVLPTFTSHIDVFLCCAVLSHSVMSDSL